MNQSDITFVDSESDPDNLGVPMSFENQENDQQTKAPEKISMANDNHIDDSTIKFDFDMSISDLGALSGSESNSFVSDNEETQMINTDGSLTNKPDQNDLLSSQEPVSHVTMDIPLDFHKDDAPLSDDSRKSESDSVQRSSVGSVKNLRDYSNDVLGSNHIGIVASQAGVEVDGSDEGVDALLSLTGGLSDMDALSGKTIIDGYPLSASDLSTGGIHNDITAEQLISNELMLASSLANHLNVLPYQVSNPDGEGTTIIDTDINITVEVNLDCTNDLADVDQVDNEDNHSNSCNADGLIHLLNPVHNSGVITDDFEDGLTNGWVRSDGGTILVQDGGAEATKFLGRFSGSDGEEAVSKTYEFGKENAGKEVTVSFDVYEMGSWDFEKLFVYTNGEVATEDTYSYLFTENAISNIAAPCSDGERVTNLAQSASEIATIASMGVGAAGAATGAAGLAIGAAGAATGALGAGTFALGTPVAALGHGGALLSAGVAGIGALSSGVAALAGTASLAAMGVGALGMFPFTHCWIMGGMMLAPAFGTALGAGIGAASGAPVYGYGAAPGAGVGAGVGLAAGSAIGAGIVGLGMFTGTVSIGMMGLGAMGAVASTALLIPSLALTATATGVGLASEAVGLAGTAVMGAGTLGMGAGALGMGAGALVTGAGALGVGAGAAGTLAGTLATNKLERVNTTDDKHTYELTATLDENGNLSLGFGSSLSGAKDCESYGIDNIAVKLHDGVITTPQPDDTCGCPGGDINVNVSVDVDITGDVNSTIVSESDNGGDDLVIEIDVDGEQQVSVPEAPVDTDDDLIEEDSMLIIDIDVNGEVEADAPNGEQPTLVLDPTEAEDPVLNIDIDVNGDLEADAPNGDLEADAPNGDLEADAPRGDRPTLVLDPTENEDPALNIDIDVNGDLEADAPSGDQPTLVLDPTEEEDPVLNIDIGVNDNNEESASASEDVLQEIRVEDVTTEEGTIDLNLLGEMLGLDLFSESTEVDSETLCDLVYQHYQSMISTSETPSSGNVVTLDAANDNSLALHATTENAAMGGTNAHSSSAFEVI